MYTDSICVYVHHLVLVLDARISQRAVEIFLCLQLMLEKKQVKDPNSGQKKTFTTGKLVKKPQPKPAVKALKSRVACLIFARRMSEAHPVRFQSQKQRRRGLVNKLSMGWYQFTKFVHRFDALFIASSAVCVVIQIKRFFFNRSSS